MTLFKIENDKVKKQRKVLFDLEKNIQKLVESNLAVFFNLDFVSSELTYGNLRLDSLAFDNNLNSFVIIEFKNKADPGLTDQGFAYKSLFKNHPEFFVLEYNKKKSSQLSLSEVDWSKTRILFISPEFTKHQEAIAIDDVPFELWRITKYENDLISLEQLNHKTESVNSEENKRAKLNGLIRLEYTEEQHLIKPTNEIKQLYSKLKKEILNWKGVRLDPQKKYLAFKAATNFVDVDLQKSAIKCHLNLSFGELSDPKNLARNVSNIGHYGNGDYEIIISKEQELDYLLSLILQAYTKNK